MKLFLTSSEDRQPQDVGVLQPSRSGLLSPDIAAGGLTIEGGMSSLSDIDDDDDTTEGDELSDTDDDEEVWSKPASLQHTQL